MLTIQFLYVIKPKKENEWLIKTDDDSLTSDHNIIADIFNDHFVKKVENLKSNIYNLET